MSKHKNHYLDKDFNQEHSADYTLLIQVGPDSFSYAVTGQNRLLVFEPDHGMEQLTALTGENNLLYADYKQRIVGLPYNGFTLVPVSLYKPDLVADFARYLDVKPHEKVFSQLLDAENQVIYKVDEGIANIISEKFGLENTVFAPKGWMRAVAACNPNDNTLYLNVVPDKVEILNFNAGKLRFYNGFEFKNEDELVYFCSFVAQEVALQNEYTTLVLSGDVYKGDKNRNRLEEFFEKVELSALKPVELPDQIASYRVLTLTALSLCGSSEAH